jgi:DNA-directed RNA polymerase specialized sigma subunit
MVSKYVGDETNKTLVQRLPQSRNELIENNIGLANERVDSFIRRVPSAHPLRDDLQSEAYLGLISASDNLSDCELPLDVTAYLVVAIDRSIHAAFDSEKVFVGEKIDDENMPPELHADIVESIFKSCKDEKDKQIVDLRLDQLSNPQIAKRMGVARQVVDYRLNSIYSRYRCAHGLGTTD